MELKSDISDGLMTGFIDCNLDSLEKYHPKLLLNDHTRGMKVLNNIISELKECEEFYFSVAFITNSGVASLVSILEDLDKRNIVGKIVTSQYQNFTQPIALERLLKFKNIQLKIVTSGNFHAKGYIFKKKDSYSFIIGSSNLTQAALSENKEWNLKLSSLENGDIMNNIIKEFDWTFENAIEVTPEFLLDYNDLYSKIRQAQSRIETELGINNNTISLMGVIPNKMQKEALLSLEELRNQGENKALLISATGTGKTYLAAFDVAKFGPKKFLFVVHRENIARAAMKSFREVIGHSINATILGGGNKNLDADYTFATIQTFSKEEILNSFEEDHFDYIVIDEVHRAGAESYRRVLDRFHPKFLLGMSATPERNDGYDIYKPFGHNIAYEIRLHKALEEKLIAPFHYYGIGELKVNGKDVQFEDAQNINTPDLAKQVSEKSNYYGCDNGRIKALVFCSEVQKAAEMASKFNEMGKPAIFLGGINSEDERSNCIKRLEQDEMENRLEYIFTVDIFNEGVDIPTVNQVIMLRPTQSSIIFVQQLGRGLRKTLNKEYLTVIDFVGNYSNSYLVPIALYGDRSFNKDNLRKFILTGSSTIPGCSTINFDAISKKRIFQAIDNANFSDARLIYDSYIGLKNELGRKPKLEEFEEYGSLDVVRIFENRNYKSYYKFLAKKDKSFTVKLEPKQELFLDLVSQKFAIGKKPHELILIKAILEGFEFPMERMIEVLERNYQIITDENTVISIANILMGNFISGSERTVYEHCIFIKKLNERFMVSDEFETMISNNEFKELLEETIDFGIRRNLNYYADRYKNTALVLYQKYTYQDVCRMLEWQKEVPGLNIGGYIYEGTTNTLPVFINYEKAEDIAAGINFEDRFEDQSKLIAISKANRTIHSNEIKRFKDSEINGTRIELFMRKNKDDHTSKEFYYLGRLKPTGYFHAITMVETGADAVEITYKLETPVRQDIYDYIVGEI